MISTKSPGLWLKLSALSLLIANSGMAADLRLVDAAKSGHREAVRSLLKDGIDVGIARLSVESSGPRVTHFTTLSFV